MTIHNTGATNDVIFKTTSTSIFYFQDCKLKLDKGCLIENQTLTNSGLEASGNQLFWNGSKIDHQSGSAYFSGSTPATSIADDFNFQRKFQAGSSNANSYMEIDAYSTNNFTSMKMAGGYAFVNYSRVVMICVNIGRFHILSSQ